MPAYLRDGYNQHGFIRGVPRLFDDVRFEYRPCLHEERLGLDLANPRLTPKELAQRTYKLLADKLLSWDVKADENDDEHLPIKLDSIRRLHPAVIERLYAIVVGDIPPDEDPMQSDRETEERLRDKQAASDNLTSVGHERLSREVKN